jgi:hypothetical protein
MFDEDKIMANPDISQEFRQFEEFCSENAGNQLIYLELVKSNPLEMDPVTLAFSLRHLLRLSKRAIDLLVDSVAGDSALPLAAILDVKGIDLDKSQAKTLRDIIHAFRDCEDPERQELLVKAFQIMAMSRERKRVRLNLGEKYSHPEDGWTDEDFGGDEYAMHMVRSVEGAPEPDSEEK